MFCKVSNLVFCFFCVQIAAEYGDGSPIPPQNKNRTVYVDIIESYDIAGDRSRSLTVRLSNETSIAEVWLYPSNSINRFSITVCLTLSYNLCIERHV